MILQGNSSSIAQGISEIWTAQAHLQPISFKSDRLLALPMNASELPMSFPKLLSCVLAALLVGCSDDQPTAPTSFDPVTAADPVHAVVEPTLPSVPETAPAVDPIAARAKQASEYFEAATQRADERLQAAERDCRTLEVNIRDDCIASATAVHESELAAARVEYAAQQARED